MDARAVLPKQIAEQLRAHTGTSVASQTSGRFLGECSQRKSLLFEGTDVDAIMARAQPANSVKSCTTGLIGSCGVATLPAPLWLQR